MSSNTVSIIEKHQYASGITMKKRYASAIISTKSYSQRLHQAFGGSLVGHWSLNDLSGSQALDYSGNGLNGVYNGPTLNGYIGIDGKPAPSLDGVNDFIALPLENLVTNAGFETAGAGGADVWAGWSETAGDGAIADEGVIVHGGSHAAKLTAGATANTLIDANYGLTYCPSGITVTLTFWARGDGTNAGRYAVARSDWGVWLISPTSTGVTGAAYAQVSNTFTVPAGFPGFVLRFMCPSANGGIAYFDDVSITIPNGTLFDGDTGTWSAWAKVTNVGVWTDATSRYICRVKSINNNNYHTIARNGAGNNTIIFQSAGGGVVYQPSQAGLTTTDWFHVALTWGGSNAIAYYNGVALDAGGAIAAWDDVINPVQSVIGHDHYVSASNPWSGGIQHVALGNTKLSAAAIARLAVRTVP